MTRHHTHISRGVCDRDRHLEHIRLPPIIIPQLAKCCQPAVESQRQIGSQRRGRSVDRDGEDVFFVARAEGLDRLRSNAIAGCAGSEGELERGEQVGIGERSRVVGAATDDSTAELIGLEVVLGPFDGFVEVDGHVVDSDANLKVGSRRRGVVPVSRMAGMGQRAKTTGRTERVRKRRTAITQS